MHWARSFFLQCLKTVYAAVMCLCCMCVVLLNILMGVESLDKACLQLEKDHIAIKQSLSLSMPGTWYPSDIVVRQGPGAGYAGHGYHGSTILAKQCLHCVGHLAVFLHGFFLARALTRWAPRCSAGVSILNKACCNQ